MPWRIAYPLCLLLVVYLAACKRNSSESSTGTNATQSAASTNSLSDQFLSLMNAGRNYLAQGDATNALAIYKKAVALVPNDPDVHLNLANAHLVLGQPADAIREADETLKLEPNLAAAYFVKGSAHLRLSNAEEAVKAFENVRKIDPGETATLFQLGVARMGLRQWEEAISAFKEGLALDPNRLHAAVHYLLAQALIRAGRQEEAQKELDEHAANAEGAGPSLGAATFERSKFTQPRVPFRLDQPDKEGIAVQFVDATKEVFGESSQNFSGPIGIIDVNHTGWYSLFVVEQGKGFRLLWNTNGIFHPDATQHSGIAGGKYSKMLVGDLQNNRFEDVIVLGDKGSHLFKFATNGTVADVSVESRLASLKAVDGTLMDLDFTGKLDLLAVTATTNDLRIFRQYGPLLFNDITSTSGVPSSLQNAQQVVMQDWNRDENMDVIVSRKEGAPLLLEKQRGGKLVPRELTNAVAGGLFTAADFDNDLRPDLAVVGVQGAIVISLNNGERREAGKFSDPSLREIVAIDYDNDGWLDLATVGEKIRVWRNIGLSAFQEQTTQLGLDKLNTGPFAELRFADFDQDCDSDFVIALANGGLLYLRNDGGNANSQVKVQLIGNRSNASGIGSKVEIQSGGLRLIRTVHSLPVEIGVGKRQLLDSFLVHWFNWPQGSAELPFLCKEPLLALELTIQEGSCPYVYAWDGNSFRFITDILGAAPLGLPLAEGRYIDSDPEEFVWVGNESTFHPKDGSYQLQITEELREVLYLDEAKLVVVDRAPDSEVHSTDKLLPGKPFPPGSLMTLHAQRPLLNAQTLEGADVTSALKVVDGRRMSPPQLRSPQLRGLAEPHGVTLDFGLLDASKPLVLVMNGWLRFGGGMANIAASQDPSLPFPFPVLEGEVAPGVWKSIDVTVGAPAGKTKTILVDLEGKLTPGTRRLRLKQAFEIHWDRIALLGKQQNAVTTITTIPSSEADLHFRGFGALQDLSSDWPLSPDYDKVTPNFYWTLTPGGWCTRYGDVSPLIATRDEGLALLNAGDELTLKFSEQSLPPKRPGTIREFFLYVDGWDKDSDFHVATGTQVEPLPFHGMNDQLYGREKRPAFPSDDLHRKYNTRWVEGRTLKQTGRAVISARPQVVSADMER